MPLSYKYYIDSNARSSHIDDFTPKSFFMVEVLSSNLVWRLKTSELRTFFMTALTNQRKP